MYLASPAHFGCILLVLVYYYYYYYIFLIIAGIFVIMGCIFPDELPSAHRTPIALSFHPGQSDATDTFYPMEAPNPVLYAKLTDFVGMGQKPTNY